jgi:23S rRNA pseudouridine1911/1915/1917 synthase
MRDRPAAGTTLLDVLSTLFPESTRTTLRQMLQQGRVRVNGEIEKNAKRAVGPHDAVDVGRKSVVAAIDPRLTILYEDDEIIVVVKAAGLLTVSTPNEKDETAQAILNDYLKTKRGNRVHVVHRLDRDTSGVMLFAKSFAVREELKGTFAAHDVDRVYYAIVEGTPATSSGTIRSYLYEDERTFDVRSVPDPARGKPAVTHYRTIDTSGGYSLLEVKLETGRKNQVRVHMFESGTPVVGDTRYGKPSDPIGRLGLHAAILGFDHPSTGRRMRFTAPLPDSFRKLFPAAPTVE